MAIVAIPLAGLVADPERHKDLGFGTAGSTIGALTITCAAAVLLALGIGALVRSTAVAVGVVVLWPAILESTVAHLPRVGEHLAPFLPLIPLFTLGVYAHERRFGARHFRAFQEAFGWPALPSEREAGLGAASLGEAA